MADGLGWTTRLRLAASTLFKGQVSARDAKELVGVFDANAAEAAFGLLAKIYGGASGEPPKRGTKEFLDAFSTSPMLRAVIDRIASRMAGTQWQLMAHKKGPNRARRHAEWQTADAKGRAQIRKDLRRHGELLDIAQHPFLDAMNRGNSLITGYGVRYLMSTYTDLVGENFLLKERGEYAEPRAFWPIPPHWIVETPTPQRRLFRTSHRSWIQDIPETEILWWTMPDPANPYVRGSAMARALADELDTDEYVSRYMSGFFYNRGVPQLMVFGEGLDRDAARELERRWSAKYKKAEHATKPFFTNTKIDVKEIGKSFKENDLVELRRYERDIVIQTFGLPPEVMGIIESSNRATIESADFLMATNVLQPRLEAMREVFQHRLIPEYDDRLVVDYVSPVAEDKEFQLKAMQAQPSMFTVDEWRAMAGHPEKEDGSGRVHLVSFNLIPTARLDQPPEPPPAPEPTTPIAEVDDEEDDDEDDLKSVVLPLLDDQRKLIEANTETLEAMKGMGEIADRTLGVLDRVEERTAEAHRSTMDTMAKLGQPAPVSVVLPDLHITVDGKQHGARTVKVARDDAGRVTGYEIDGAEG